MPKYIKLTGIALLFILGLCSFSFSEEAFTVKTSYPLPTSSYNELTAAGNSYLAASSGNVGIGTTGPADKLDVRGSIRLTGDMDIESTSGDDAFVRQTINNGSLSIVGGNDNLLDSYITLYGRNYRSVPDAGTIQFRTPNAAKTSRVLRMTIPGAVNSGAGYIDTSEGMTIAGNVGIGTVNPTPGFKLDVNGDVRCQSLTQYSSLDYKKDIQRLTSSDYLAILKELEETDIFRFRYKEQAENSKLRLGLIAEESPREITSHDGKGIDLGQAVAFLIAAVKLQAEELKGLKQEISRLRSH